MSIKTKVDTSSAFAGLDALAGPLRVSLARSMGVAGGEVIRDSAKAQVQSKTGNLRRSIYLAYRDGVSTDSRVVYSISWNSKIAPHGHLVEFGHWRYNKFINGYPQKSLINGKTYGRGPQDHGGPGALAVPVWTAANPFLRPGYEASKARAQLAMIERARVRLPELLAEKVP